MESVGFRTIKGVERRGWDHQRGGPRGVGCVLQDVGCRVYSVGLKSVTCGVGCAVYGVGL